MIIYIIAIGMQTIPPIQQVDIGGAIRTYQNQQRLEIDRDNANTYAKQTEVYAQSQDGGSGGSDQELERAQNVLVGRLISDGNCADARRVALGEGRFDLVDRVIQLCRQPEPQP